MTNAPTWADILEEPFTVVVLGRRGSGKTALGHRLLDVFHEDRDAYIINFPRERRDLLPEWLTWLPPTIEYDSWPEDSVTLVNEAHHLAHARQSMGAENLELDRLVTVSRQRNASVIFDTQYARRLDVTGVMGANAIIFRYPSLMADDFERSQMRKLVTEARDALDQFVDVHETDDYVMRDETDELLKHAYIIGEKFRGLYPHRVHLPEHWHENISKAYSGADSNEDMADIEDVGTKSLADVEGAFADHIEIEEDADETTEPDTGDGEIGRQFVREMIDDGNRVTPNTFSDPVVELIAPIDMEDEINDLLDRNNLEPNFKDAVAQDPSFAEQRPEAADHLVAWHFLLDDAGDLDSSTYLLGNIVDGLKDEPVLATKSRAVEARVF